MLGGGTGVVRWKGGIFCWHRVDSGWNADLAFRNGMGAGIGWFG
jgi:hypothetical protein